MSFPIALILLLYLGAAGGAAGAEEAAGLRASASARIDAFTEHFRKTGDRQSRVPDLRTAVDELSRAHRDSAARSDAAGAAESLVRMGQIQRLVGNWKGALQYYEQALPLIQRAGDQVLLATARTGMALAAMSVPDLGAAATHAGAAAAAAERTTDARARFFALSALGAVQGARFDLNAAADSINRALDVARKADDATLISFGYMDRGDVWLKRAERCDFQRSFDPCRQALEQARADYAESRQRLTSLGYEGLGKVVDGFIAEVGQREKLVGIMQARDKAVRGAGMFEPSVASDVLVTERYVSSGMQMPAAVEGYYLKMKAERAEAGGFGDSTAARMRYVEGLAAEMGGRQDEALARYLEAVTSLERDRGRLRDDRERGTFLEDKTGFYTAAMLQLLERRRHAEAFELMERMRARGMADLLASRNVELAQGPERTLYAESTRLKSEIAARQAQLLDLASRGDAAARDRAKALGTEVAIRESELAALDARIAREAPRLRQLTLAEPVALARLQQTMREEGFEMLQYLVLEHAVILWHISHDAVHVRNVFLPRSALQEKAARLRKSLTDPNAGFDARAARQLYLYLVQPAKARLKARRVVIVPHDDLYYVPFQVLMGPDGRAFGEVQAISYVPSATVLMSLKRPASGPAGALFAAADPHLPAAPDEVKAVAKLYPDARVITDRLARKGEVRAALKGRDVVHLSVHGKFDAAEPLLSHLVFAAGDGNDGRLTAAEMFGLPLERARLVVLSACETGRSRADNAGDVQGMLRALLYAGAGGVVLSYWAVDSDATAAWMEAFHRAARDRHPAEAARSALAAVKSRKEYAHPYYWAAFMTVGR